MNKENEIDILLATENVGSIPNLDHITTDNRTFIILPINDCWWICQINEQEVKHLAKAPGGADARYFTSPSEPLLFAYVDQVRKRVALYRYLNAEPWFEKIISPSTLPRNCRADDVLIHNGLLYVGGRGKMGECLWTRDKKDENWRLIPMPSDICLSGDLFSRYKSIDLVFWDGKRLIAVDNFVIPKWILTYDITDNKEITHLESIGLCIHTTYEKVITGAMNQNYIALISGGINHGTVSIHLSILDTGTLTEIASCCVFSQDNFGNTSSEKSYKVTNVAFLKDYLLLATRDGVLCTKIDNPTESLKKCQFDKIELNTIVEPKRFVMHPCIDYTFFVVGIDSCEKQNYEQVDIFTHPRSKIKSPLLQEKYWSGYSSFS